MFQAKPLGVPKAGGDGSWEHDVVTEEVGDAFGFVPPILADTDTLSNSWRLEVS